LKKVLKELMHTIKKNTKEFKKRIIDISYKHNLSHIGSCLTAVDLLDEMYRKKRNEDITVLSSGHAGLALYVILEHYEGWNAEELLEKHGIHPNRDSIHGIWCSTGSLGHGLGIGVGYALADRTKRVYILLSDGELAEGSIYEACNVIREQKLSNIEIYINFNGWGAYRKITIKSILPVIQAVDDVCPVHLRKTKMPELEYIDGLKAHYTVLSEEQYLKLIKQYEA